MFPLKHDALYCLIPEDITLDPIEVTQQWIARHEPVNGGYFLRFENGLTGFMTAEMFEREFKPVGPAETS
ncbi:hypothetical protein [Denitrobaculum tricleocarpae]|uniref:Uncharacterized protein n=1 Tax=Denitrobaculum tricleocarpae TaxID=2591009 RepID=A0A545SSZ5_9PROT|nr:hypothetical protein [Denitrobaculum tricleocarpae]TQV68090.1 hypothetical protein FKG95_29135 [Denitrobaculum tricleocarpae]